MILTACFTGHRPDKLGGYSDNNPMALDVKARLDKAVDYLISQGVTEFITGMALGVDMYAAEVVIAKKASNPKLRLIAAIPFQGQEGKWPKSSQDRFHAILSHCDEQHIVCAGAYSAYKMQLRNEWMVDRSDYVIAVWDGTTGGTYNCYQYAQRAVNVRKVLRINPKVAAPVS